jgi:hypothetical protein
MFFAGEVPKLVRCTFLTASVRCSAVVHIFAGVLFHYIVYMTQVLETVIAEQKAKAADDLSEVKVALEQSQEQDKVSLDHKVDQLAFQIH